MWERVRRGMQEEKQDFCPNVKRQEEEKSKRTLGNEQEVAGGVQYS